MTAYSYPGNLRAITAGSCTYVLQRGSNPSTPSTATATATSSDDSEWWKQERYRRDFEQNGRSGNLWTCATDGSSNACPESELAAREEWYHHQCWWRSSRLRRDQWWKEDVYICDWKDHGERGTLWTAEQPNAKTKASNNDLNDRVEWCKNTGPKGTVELWTPLPNLSLQGLLQKLAISPDGFRLATAGEKGALALWRFQTKTSSVSLVEELSGHRSKVSSVAFSADGCWLVSGDGDGAVRVWDLSGSGPAACVATLEEHTGAVTSVAFSPDGKKFVSGSVDKTVKVWNFASSASGGTVADCIATRATIGPIPSVIFSPDSNNVAWCSLATAFVWAYASGNGSGAVLEGHTAYVHGIAYSVDGAKLATASDDKTIRIWNVSVPGAAQRIATVSGHSSGVISVCFSNSNTSGILASGDEEGLGSSWSGMPLGQSPEAVG